MDTNIILTNYEAAKKRVGIFLAQKESVIDAGYQSLNYLLFEDILKMLGYAKALNTMRDDEIQRYFKIATECALEVYRYKGTTVGRISYLPSMEEDVFIDESMTNPWTHARAVYAAAASGSFDELQEIAGISASVNKSKQVKTLAVVDKYLDLLLGLVSKEDLTDKMNSFLVSFKNSKNENEVFWYLQALIIKAILESDKKGFEDSVEKLIAFYNEYYSQDKYKYGSDRFLNLPVLGLTGIKEYYDVQLKE